MRLLSLTLLFFAFVNIMTENINTDYLADDPNLENYFITYVNNTKVVTPVSKKFLK